MAASQVVEADVEASAPAEIKSSHSRQALTVHMQSMSGAVCSAAPSLIRDVALIIVDYACTRLLFDADSVPRAGMIEVAVDGRSMHSTGRLDVATPIVTAFSLREMDVRQWTLRIDPGEGRSYGIACGIADPPINITPVRNGTLQRRAASPPQNDHRRLIGSSSPDSFADLPLCTPRAPSLCLCLRIGRATSHVPGRTRYTARGKGVI
jgi:hypothetical protein